MYLKQKIQAVNRVFMQADTHVSSFRKRSGLACPPACGVCCFKSDIQATVLEFLPAAYELYLNGKTLEILEKLEKRSDNICVFYDPTGEGGCCSEYACRGLVCRLFGYSKRNDRQGNPALVTCRLIKELAESSRNDIKLTLAPNISDYYLKLFGIDPDLSIKYLPVNRAVRKALEIVLLDLQYRKKPA